MQDCDSIFIEMGIRKWDFSFKEKKSLQITAFFYSLYLKYQSDVTLNKYVFIACSNN